MSEVKISAEPRTEFGKGGARRTRRAGKVPAVLYGHGENAQAHRAAGPRVRRRHPPRRHEPALQHRDHRRHQALALPKAIQRDPIKDTFEHVDLLLVRRGEKVTVEVPVQLTGEAARDTLIVHEHDTLSVTADATKLPDHLEASIEGLEAGTQVTAGDVELPAGVELAADPELIVAVGHRRPDRRAARGDARGRGGRRGGRGRAARPPRPEARGRGGRRGATEA